METDINGFVSSVSAYIFLIIAALVIGMLLRHYLGRLSERTKIYLHVYTPSFSRTVLVYQTNTMPYELDIKMLTRRIGLRVQDYFSFRPKLITDWYDCKIISSTFRQDLLTVDRTFHISHWAAFKFSRLMRKKSGFSFVFLFKTDVRIIQQSPLRIMLQGALRPTNTLNTLTKGTADVRADLGN